RQEDRPGGGKGGAKGRPGRRQRQAAGFQGGSGDRRHRHHGGRQGGHPGGTGAQGAEDRRRHEERNRDADRLGGFHRERGTGGADRERRGRRQVGRQPHRGQLERL